MQLLFIMLMSLFIFSCSGSTESSDTTCPPHDTIYSDTLVLIDTFYRVDTIYQDTLRDTIIVNIPPRYTLYTVYRSYDNFEYIKAYGVYSMPVKYIDYQYDYFGGYYYFTNNKYLMIAK